MTCAVVALVSALPPSAHCRCVQPVVVTWCGDAVQGGNLHLEATALSMTHGGRRGLQRAPSPCECRTHPTISHLFACNGLQQGTQFLECIILCNFLVSDGHEVRRCCDQPTPCHACWPAAKCYPGLTSSMLLPMIAYRARIQFSARQSACRKHMPSSGMEDPTQVCATTSAESMPQKTS